MHRLPRAPDADAIDFDRHRRQDEQAGVHAIEHQKRHEERQEEQSPPGRHQRCLRNEEYGEQQVRQGILES
jgi:hypothetical protein